VSDTEPPPSPAQELMQLALGYFASRAVHAAADLRLADLLADGARSAADLARATNTHEPSLYRLLRALASIGLVVHRADGRFELTEA
jgi:predicted transcriptional regulator